MLSKHTIILGKCKIANKKIRRKIGSDWKEMDTGWLRHSLGEERSLP